MIDICVYDECLHVIKFILIISPSCAYAVHILLVFQVESRAVLMYTSCSCAVHFLRAFRAESKGIAHVCILFLCCPLPECLPGGEQERCSCIHLVVYAVHLLRALQVESNSIAHVYILLFMLSTSCMPSRWRARASLTRRPRLPTRSCRT